MQIKKNAIYAVRLCQVLSGQESPMSLVDLGQAIDLDPRGVQQALIPLLREGIVSSRRGSRGGYWLQKKGVSVGDIVTAFGDGICAVMAGDSEHEAAIRRKIGSRVEGCLRRMKLSDI